MMLPTTDRASAERVGARPDAAHAAVLDASGLGAILRPGVNVCIWRRRFEPAFAAWLERQAAGEPFELEAVLRGARPDPTPLLEALPPGPQRVQLGADLAELAARFAALAGCARVKATLSGQRRDTCRKFHVDYAGIRLLCTYAGPGTEWIPNELVRRDILSRYDLALDVANRSIQGREGAARSAQAGEVVLLKGEAWPGNAGNGAVHRSPPIEASGARRILLTLDAAG